MDAERERERESRQNSFVSNDAKKIKERKRERERERERERGERDGGKVKWIVRRRERVGCGVRVREGWQEGEVQEIDGREVGMERDRERERERGGDRQTESNTLLVINITTLTFTIFLH